LYCSSGLGICCSRYSHGRLRDSCWGAFQRTHLAGAERRPKKKLAQAELDDQNPVASGPDLILAQTNPALQALLDAAPSQPIIFFQVSDPVGGGFVKSFSHPGASITGFTNFEAEIGGKRL
jgi:hypothetical protein